MEREMKEADKIKLKEKVEKDLKREAKPDELVNAERGLRYLVEMLWDKVEVLEEEIKKKANKKP